MTIAGIIVACLSVAVVKAASAVVVRTVEDRVLTLSVVAGRDARSVVIAVPGASSHVDAIDMVTTDRQWQCARVCQIIGATSGPTTGCLGEIVTTTGLVVDDGDDAARTSAERILCCSVGIATCAERIDIRRRVIRGTPDLIKVPIVGAKSARTVLWAATHGVPRRINVAGSRAGGLDRSTNKTQRANNDTHTNNEYQQGFSSSYEHVIVGEDSFNGFTSLCPFHYLEMASSYSQ